MVVLAVGGLFLQSTLPVNVTFGQALAPVSAATVSSLMMGFAWGTGGLSVPLVGLIADRVGIEHDARRTGAHSAARGGVRAAAARARAAIARSGAASQRRVHRAGDARLSRETAVVR